MRRWLALVGGFLTLYGIAVFFPALRGDRALFWHDVSIAYLPLRTSAAQAIADGHLPLWDAQIGNGFPVLAEGQAGVFYPLHIIAYTGLPPYHAYAILVVIHCVLAGAFMALFCRAHGMRLMPCLTAGLVYGFSGFFITHAIHIGMLEAAAWLPLVLLCLEMWLRCPGDYRWLIGAALALGAQELAAMPQVFFYSMLTAILYMAVACVVRRPAATEGADRRAAGRGVKGGGIAAATAVVLLGALLVCAVQIIPTSGLVKASDRHSVSAQQLRELALTPRNLLYFAHPYLLGSYAEGNYFGRDHYYEVCGFVGTAGLLFAVVGAAVGRGRGWAFALVLTPVALFMALAHQNPLYELFPGVPGFNWFRGAGRYVLLSSLGLAVLAGYGIQTVGHSRRALRLALVLSLAGLAVCVAGPTVLRANREAVTARLTTMVGSGGDQDETPHERAAEKTEFILTRLSPHDPHFLLILICLAAPAAACLASLRGACEARWLGELALALTVAQLFVFSCYQNPTIPVEYYQRPPLLAAAQAPAQGQCVYTDRQERLQEALAGSRGWLEGDLSYYWHEREFLRPNRQKLYGVRSANVFYALAPKRYWTLTRIVSSSLQGQPDPGTGLRARSPVEVLSAVGASIICTADASRMGRLDIVRDFGGWVALRNGSAVPEAYFATTVVPCWTARAALEHMCSAAFSAHRPVIELPDTEDLVLSPGRRPGRVESVLDDHGHLTIRCRAVGRELLVVRQTFDPHFVCLVDGNPTPTFRANYLFRAVPLAPGRHTVEFVYRATDLHVGMAVSLAALAAMLIGLIALGRRRIA